MTTIIQPLAEIGVWAEPPFGATPAGFSGPMTFSLGIGLSFNGLAAPANGEIFGLTIQGAGGITAGFIDCIPTIGGSPVGTVPFRVDTNVPIPALFRVTDAARFFQAGDLLGIEADAANGLLPNPTGYLVFLTVIFNRGVSTDEQGI